MHEKVRYNGGYAPLGRVHDVSDEPRDKNGKWTSGVIGRYTTESDVNDSNKLRVDDLKKIKPEEFYKYEYLSKNNQEWVQLKKTDSPVRLREYGYEIRLKELYRYTL